MQLTEDVSDVCPERRGWRRSSELWENAQTAKEQLLVLGARSFVTRYRKDARSSDS